MLFILQCVVYSRGPPLTNLALPEDRGSGFLFLDFQHLRAPGQWEVINECLLNERNDWKSFLAVCKPGSEPSLAVKVR